MAVIIVTTEQNKSTFLSTWKPKTWLKGQKPKLWRALHLVKRAIYQENMTCYVISSHFYIRDMIYGHRNIKYWKI